MEYRNMKMEMGMAGKGQGTKGTTGEKGLEIEGKKGRDGMKGLRRSMGVTGAMGAMGVEGITGLGPPTLRATSGNQLTFVLQRECYSIPVFQVREDAWLVKITPVLQMPGYAREVVKLPGNAHQLDLQLNSAELLWNPERNFPRDS